MKDAEKIVGIIGGMGPEATVDLMSRIIRNTPALDDIDHIRCIVDNNPKVPSRIKALLEGEGENPGPVMAEMARGLENWGADFLCIPCNTAHNYYDYVKSAVSIPVLNIIELTTQAAINHVQHDRRIGIMASPAVRLTKLYDNAFDAYQVTTVYPDEDSEAVLFKLIKRIKAGHTGKTEKDILARVADNLIAQSVNAIIIACTELGIIANNMDFAIPVIDASEVLAKHIVRLVKA